MQMQRLITLHNNRFNIVDFVWIGTYAGKPTVLEIKAATK